MEPLKIHERNLLPLVYFDKAQSVFLIEGKSIPEDSADFYSVAFKWLKEYFKEPNPETILDIKLNYYNSSSAREIANLLKYLDEMYQKDINIKVNWIYNPDDEIMKENGEDFGILFSLPINIIPY